MRGKPGSLRTALAAQARCHPSDERPVPTKNAGRINYMSRVTVRTWRGWASISLAQPLLQLFPGGTPRP